MQWPKLSALLCLAGLALASCDGGGNVGVAPVGPSVAQNGEHKGTGKATIVIAIPRAKRRGARAHYISAATHSIAITITQSLGQTRTFNRNLTPATNPSCTPSPVVCTLQFFMGAGKYTAAFATYDGLLDAHGNPTGNELSANQQVAFTLAQGQSTPIRVTLGGIPASVALVPNASSTLFGNATQGFTLERCTAKAQSVSVFAIDADGNYILGAGAPTLSLRSSSTLLAVTPPRQNAPNTFILTPPAPPVYAFPGNTVFLTASATPSSQSGGFATSLSTKITYSSDICGIFTEFPVPTASSQPRGITVGPDGAIWFTEKTAGKLGRIPTTATAANPQITEFTIPTMNSGPDQITTGPDGGLWFTECYRGQIGRAPASGSPIFEFPLPSSSSSPRGITTGSDGAMWFTELKGNAIGRIPSSGKIVLQEISGADSEQRTDRHRLRVGRRLVVHRSASKPDWAHPNRRHADYGISGLSWIQLSTRDRHRARLSNVVYRMRRPKRRQHSDKRSGRDGVLVTWVATRYHSRSGWGAMVCDDGRSEHWARHDRRVGDDV